MLAPYCYKGFQMVKEKLEDILAYSMNEILKDENYQNIFNPTIKTASTKNPEVIVKSAFNKLLEASKYLENKGLKKSAAKILNAIDNMLNETGSTNQMNEQQLAMAAAEATKLEKDKKDPIKEEEASIVVSE